jgi:23S rRNA (pseudouridine1915-N3)-methyltransferase
VDIRIHAIGKRMPAWVKTGFEEYAGRFPGNINITLRELALPERTSNSDIHRLKEEEGQRLLDGVQPDDVVIALDERGKQWDSHEVAKRLEMWLEDKRNISLLIGGPDGLSAQCLQRADIRWSLSKLTLPHMMVRIMLVEQIYRAMTILQKHPYHR